MKRALPLAIALLVLPLSACGGSGGDDGKAAASKGPIKIWYANNPDEIAWAKKMVASWNSAHPKEKIRAQEIPAGKSSEEVIGAAITAGNAPCLVFNTSPAAVSQFQKQGGLVPLDDFPGATQHIEKRSGDAAEQYKSDDGKYYQLPWKSNPVMISYNKDVFSKAGLDPDKPGLTTYKEFLATSQKLVDKGGVKAAIWPSPSSEFFQSWFDFYPLFTAESGGKQLLEDGKAQFNGPEGQAVADFWQSMYDKALAQKEKYNGDAFADGKAAMTIAGPWAVKVYDKKVDYGVVPVPTSKGKPAAQTRTFSDAKSVGMFNSCKNRGTAWDVLKFASSKEQDRKLLEITGQMPVREDLTGDYADFFAKNPKYKTYAQAAGNTVEVPNVPKSIAIWQNFRDAYSRSVIFGKADPQSALKKAASEVEKLAAQK
ncbi:extracellular solute-binding protein [Streptomyces winkii]|uniref:extracellular solute-binding protein n=1 Tax=Streptomyces winkii TaxID=3051178 RepID=UPI0028D026A0|nr:extracellular solute-binding protein [Streptomyces sp. DSM 40971]